jgi:hypothetical protein
LHDCQRKVREGDHKNDAGFRAEGAAWSEHDKQCFAKFHLKSASGGNKIDEFVTCKYEKVSHPCTCDHTSKRTPKTETKPGKLHPVEKYHYDWGEWKYHGCGKEATRTETETCRGGCSCELSSKRSLKTETRPGNVFTYHFGEWSDHGCGKESSRTETESCPVSHFFKPEVEGKLVSECAAVPLPPALLSEAGPDLALVALTRTLVLSDLLA